MAESAVVRKYLINHSFVFHRFQFYYGEVDLGFLNRDGALILVEVKSISSLDFVDVRISKGQKRRLSQCMNYLIHELDRPVAFHYVLVPPKGEFIVFEEDILD